MTGTTVASLGSGHGLLPPSLSKICKTPPTYQMAAWPQISPVILPDLLQLANGPVSGVGTDRGDVR